MGRAVRSDKKVDCKPTIPINLKECINRLSYVTSSPVKDVGEYISLVGLRSTKVLEHLSRYFRRDYSIGTTYYVGQLSRKSLRSRKIDGPSDRITIKFKQSDFDEISDLAYALDVTPSKAVALLLEVTVHQTDFINTYTKKFLKQRLDENRIRELKKVIDYLNRHNPKEEKISWLTLLSFLYDELKLSANSINNKIDNWIEKIVYKD